MTSLTRMAQGSLVCRQGSSGRNQPVLTPGPASRASSPTPSPLSLVPDRPQSAMARPNARSRTGRSAPDVVGIRATPLGGGRSLPDHELAPEETDLVAVLVERLGLHRDDPPVVAGLRRHPFDDLRLGVDGVAVEGREPVEQGLDVEVGDAG